MTKQKPPSLKAKDRSSAWELSFLRAVAGYAQAICGEQGTMLERNTLAPGCVHMVREVRNYENFTFHLDTSRTVMGGNELKVWYHPGRRFYEALEPVLAMEWHLNIDETVVPTVRSPHPSWQTHIRRLIRIRDDLALAEEADSKAAPLPPGMLGRRAHRLA